jgi:hypothetical protein
MGAKSLTKLVLPEKLSSLAASAFSGCTSLEELEFLSSGVSMSYYTFQNCTKLKTVKFHGTKLGIEGFPGCDELENIIVYSSEVSAINDDCFSQANYLFGNLYVPDEAVDIYKETDGWKNFKNILPISSYASVTSVTSVIDETNNSPVYYDMNGNIVVKPQHGIFIRKAGNNVTKVYLE